MRTRVWSQVVVVLLAALLGAGCQGCELGDDDDDFDCGTCDHGATCVPAMRACACPTGYAGDGTTAGTGCADVDECTAGTDGCVDVHGTCTNTVGGHTCGCAPGYAGDGTAAGTGCTDVDECAAGTDDCLDHGRCANTDGGYTCGCAPGYAGDGTAAGTGCTDVDECTAGTDDCAAVGGACANTPGGFTCSCAPGFTGDGRTCTDVDECALGLDHCVGDDDGGLCTNTPGSYSCACDEDAVGDGVVTTAGGTGCTEVATNPRLVVPRRMVADKTLTVRADVLDASGKVDARGCYDTLGSVRMTRLADGADQPLTVTEFDDHLPVPADSLRFYHGVGSVSFTLDAGAATPPGRYRLTVTVGGRTATRIIRVLPSPTWRVMPATLTGADLVWGPHENIRLSAHTTEIPAGSTLVIHPGTLIMVDTTGGVEDGTLVNVNGQVDARGTLARPIHIFSARGPAAMTHTVSGSLSNANAWRGLFFFGAGSSSLRYLVLTGAGNGVVVSHPRPPILNLFGTHNLVVEDCVLVDSTGMMFQSPGTGSYQIRRTLVSRVGIGAEFLSAGHTLRIEDSWWTGIGRGPSTPVRYDGDGIHVDGAGSNQVIRGCIIADIGDDGIDHSNSTFTVENTIIHGVRDKAVSLTAGMITMRGSLVFDAGSGIRGTARVFTSTIAAPSPIATVDTLQESIVWPQSVSTCTGNVGWSIVGSAGDLGCGTGNRSVDPRFTDPGQCDFRPLPGSPAWTAGPTGGLVGFPGFPSWQP